ncbi:MAG: hypothetical protein LR011_04060 [Verrucomicrobia bacterium]|nr:hypothetical protein [Verrucomicrobiota bacterium]
MKHESAMRMGMPGYSASRVFSQYVMPLILVLIFPVIPLMGQGPVDERLIGEWAAITEGMEGEKASITRDAIVVFGERMPIRFISQGLFQIGNPGEEERVQYRISGDTLTITSDGESSSWRRVATQVPVNSSVQNPLASSPPAPLATPVPGGSGPDRFARPFKGDNIALSLKGNQTYTGELQFRGTSYPVTAQADGNQLKGRFQMNDGRSFEFNGNLTGDSLSFVTGSTTYVLAGEPLKPQGNPLDIGGNGNPLATPPVVANPLDSQPASRGALIFKEYKLMDPGLNNMVASTVLMPESWKAEGGLQRMPPAVYSIPIIVDVKFIAPDGRQVRFFPSLMFEFDNFQQGQMMQATMQGNLYMPLARSPGAWIMEMSRMNPDPAVSNLTVVREEDVPEVTAKLRQQSQQLIQQIEANNQLGRQTGFLSNYEAKCTKVVLTYNRDGRSYEETLLISWSAMTNIWQGQVVSGLWGILGMYSLRGPANTDYVNDPELLAVLSSARVNPAWQAEMDKYWAQLAQIRHKGNMDRLNASSAAHQKRMNTLNETSDILMSGWKSRNESMDRIHAKTIDAIHEQTPYTTPSGETVKLPSFYDNVYTDGNGRYILNNNSLYEPNTDPSVNSQSWQRIHAQP